MNYGNPDGNRPMRVSGGAGVTLPIHEQVRQSRAALCGMAEGGAYRAAEELAPLLTDESTARCVEGESDIDRISAFVRRYPAFYITGGDARILLDDRDDLARRCADLENGHANLANSFDTLQRLYDEARAELAFVRTSRARLQADFDDLRRLSLPPVADGSWHYGGCVPIEQEPIRLGQEFRNIESPKAQGSHSHVAPAGPPHRMPAALGDCDRGELIWSSDLPEPARLNESIPVSAAPQVLAVTAKPAPGPMPARALRHSR